jgi:mannose-6-phosphate isomerase-like protein (cupin superfamily)
MGRSIVLLLVAGLALATGLALLAAGFALSDPGIAAVSPGGAGSRADLVQRYYAAVNDAIRTGATSPLDALLAAGFDDGAAAGAGNPSREGFKQYLARLHRTIPGARVAVEDVVVGEDGETVLARVAVVGLPLADPAPPWGPLDAFRVAGGVLVERRSARDGAVLAAPLIRVDLPALPPAVTGLVLARLTFAPGATLPQLLSAGPTVLVPEAGSLSIEFGPEMRQGQPLAIESEHVLCPGEFQVVPPGIRYSLRNAGPVPAVVLGWTLGMPPAAGEEAAAFAAHFLPHDLSLEAGRPWGTVEILAGGDVGRWPAGPVTVAVGRAVLAPGVTLAPRAAETALLVVEHGEVAAEREVAAEGTSGASAESPVRPRRYQDPCQIETRPLAAGDSTCLPAGAVVLLRNTGAGPAVLLALTITPVEADTDDGLATS